MATIYTLFVLSTFHFKWLTFEFVEVQAYLWQPGQLFKHHRCQQSQDLLNSLSIPFYVATYSISLVDRIKSICL